MAKVAATTTMLAAQNSNSFKAAAEIAVLPPPVDPVLAVPVIPGGTDQQAMTSSVPDPVGVADGQVLLRDVRHLVRQGHVAPPTGFTKLGLPVLFFPEESVPGRGLGLATVPESDLHLLFKYYLAVVPRTEQASGFALIIDRRLDDWTSVRTVFKKVVSLFPAR